MAWPDDYDDWTAPAPNAIRNNLTTVVEAIYTAIETLQHEIGLLPRGASATVAERFDALEALVTDAIDPTTAIGQAITDHVDDADPHSGKYGKIISPAEPDGGGTVYAAGSPSSTGPDDEIWVDTAT